APRRSLRSRFDLLQLTEDVAESVDLVAVAGPVAGALCLDGASVVRVGALHEFAAAPRDGGWCCRGRRGGGSRGRRRCDARCGAGSSGWLLTAPGRRRGARAQQLRERCRIDWLLRRRSLAVTREDACQRAIERLV